MIIHDSEVFFLDFQHFLKISWTYFSFKNVKDSNYLISWGEPILQNGWIIWSHPVLYFTFKNYKERNYGSFTAFQSVLHNTADLLWDFWNLMKLKIGDLMSRGESILHNGWIIWSSLLQLISRISRTQIRGHSLNFDQFYMTQQSFSQIFKSFSNLRRGS